VARSTQVEGVRSKVPFMIAFIALGGGGGGSWEGPREAVKRISSSRTLFSSRKGGGRCKYLYPILALELVKNSRKQSGEEGFQYRRSQDFKQAKKIPRARIRVIPRQYIMILLRRASGGKARRKEQEGTIAVQ